MTFLSAGSHYANFSTAFSKPPSFFAGAVMPIRMKSPSIVLGLLICAGLCDRGVCAQDADEVARVVAKSLERLAGTDEAAHGQARADLEALVKAATGSNADWKRRVVAKAFARALREAQAPRVKLAFLQGVQSIGKWEVVSTVGGILNNPEEEPVVRVAALHALEVNPAVGAKKELRKAITTTTGPLRLGVIKVLGTRHDPLSAGALIAAANEADPDVQLAALEALADIGEISAVPIAESALESYEGERLEAARRAYVRYGDSLVRNSERGQARRIYLRAQELGSEYRAAALVGLARANLQSEIGLVLEAFGDSDEHVRKAAAEAAALYKAPAVTVAVMERLAAATDSAERLQLLEVLAARGDSKAQQGLVRALVDGTDVVVQAKCLQLLAGSFARKNDEPPVEVIEFLLSRLGGDGPLAAAAEEFLLKLSGARLTEALSREAARTRSHLQAIERLLAAQSR